MGWVISQAGILSDNTTPSQDIETITGMSGGAAPPDGAGNFNMLAADTIDDYDDGITSVTDAGTNSCTYLLTNRETATLTTTDATPTTLYSIDLGATAGTYSVWGVITAYDVTDAESGTYFYNAAFKTDGASATFVGASNTGEFEELNMEPSEIDFSVSGNNALVVVTGVAAKTINWNLVFEYRFQG